MTFSKPTRARDLTITKPMKGSIFKLNGDQNFYHQCLGKCCSRSELWNPEKCQTDRWNVVRRNYSTGEEHPRYYPMIIFPAQSAWTMDGRRRKGRNFILWKAPTDLTADYNSTSHLRRKQGLLAVTEPSTAIMVVAPETIYFLIK